jgi:hypothetical protein
MDRVTKPRRHDVLWIAVFFVGYLLLTWVVLPRLGVPT